MKKILLIFCALFLLSICFSDVNAQDNGNKEDKIKAKEANAKMKEAQKEEAKKLKREKQEDIEREKKAILKMKEARAKQKEVAKASAGGLSWKDYREAGDELFFSAFYFDAIPYYEKAYNLKPTKVCLPCKVAESYHLTRDYQKAEDWYFKVLAIDSSKNNYPLARFYHAINIKSQGRYEDAIRQFDKFISDNRSKKKKSKSKKSRKKDPMSEYLRLARRESLGCEQGIAMSDTFTLSKNSIKHLDREFNKRGYETSPFYTDSKQFVYSQMPANIYSAEKSESLESKISKIYTAVDVSGFWRNDGEISGSVNSTNQHTMDPALSLDGNRIYYSRCKFDGKPGMNCKIYYSEISTRGWTDGKELGPAINMEGFSSMHPNLTIDADSNEILYFVSDRPGGRGRLDIWYSIRLADGTFKRAKNAGGIINTNRDEVTPFFDNNENKMYFSSNGHSNVGGLDVFRSQKNDYGSWEKPVNMQMPINSSSDDWHFTMDRSGFKGLFASNRPKGNSEYGETCCEDIYMVTFAEPVFAVQGKIFEEYGGQRTKSVDGSVTLFSSTNDSMIGSMSMLDKDQFFFKLQPSQNYFMVSTKEGFGDLIYEFNTKNIRFSDTLNIDLVLEREEPDKQWIGQVIGTVFFEYDRFRLKSEAANTMDSVVSFIRQHPEYMYEAGGHTDNKGREEYNQKLSLERALSVRKYIIYKGAESDKIIAVGYGESSPLVPNELPDGSDNLEGRQKNRRVEFKVIGESDQP